MITIFRGDDTTFKGEKRLRVTINTRVSLVGCCAEFELCGVVKRIQDVSTGTFYISLTAEDTAKMPVGVHSAVLRVYDDESRRRTVDNAIRVNITERVDAAYSADDAIEVALGATVKWRDVTDKPTINGRTLSGNITDADLAIKGIVNDGLGAPVDLPEEFTSDQMRVLVNRLAALVRNSMQAAATAVALVALALALPFSALAEDGAGRVDTKVFGGISNKSNVVVRVDLSGLVNEGELEGVRTNLENAVAAHTSNGNIHVTAADKARWEGTVGDYIPKGAGYNSTDPGATTVYVVTNVVDGYTLPHPRGGVQTRNGDDYTSYAHDGIAVNRNGSTTDYMFDASDSGVVRRTELSNYKTTQNSKASPSASGNTYQFIDTVSQDSSGVITATKKTVRSASTSQSGIVQLNDTYTSTSTTYAPTANALKNGVDAAKSYTDSAVAPLATTNALNEAVAPLASTNDLNTAVTGINETMATLVPTNYLEGVVFDLSTEDSMFDSLTNIIIRLGGTWHE